MIRRLLHRVLHRPPADWQQRRAAARVLARQAAALARQRATARRPALIAHIASFGPAGQRGLEILGVNHE